MPPLLMLFALCPVLTLLCPCCCCCRCLQKSRPSMLTTPPASGTRGQTATSQSREDGRKEGASAAPQAMPQTFVMAAGICTARSSAAGGCIASSNALDVCVQGSSAACAANHACFMLHRCTSQLLCLCALGSATRVRTLGRQTGASACSANRQTVPALHSGARLGAALCVGMCDGNISKGPRRGGRKGGFRASLDPREPVVQLYPRPL